MNVAEKKQQVAGRKVASKGAGSIAKQNQAESLLLSTKQNAEFPGSHDMGERSTRNKKAELRRSRERRNESGYRNSSD